MKSIAWDGKAVYPSKIVCIGRNYAEHIKEFDNEPDQDPVIFIKPNSAISDEVYSSASELIHYEGEITFLIASGELRGVGFGLDLTKRDLQYQLKDKGWPWERAKSFDRSAVCIDPSTGGSSRSAAMSPACVWSFTSMMCWSSSAVMT